MILKFEIQETIKIKDYLRKKLSSNLLIKLGKDNSFIVNNLAVKNYYTMHEGDILYVITPSTISANVKATKGDIEIIYEDDYFIILSKPNNMATIPTRAHYLTSLANYLNYYYITKGIASGIHFVSRLDEATSGLILASKDIYIEEILKKNILEKKYLLKVEGHLDNEGTIKTNIIKDPNSLIKRKCVEGDKAITIYKTLKAEEDYSIIEAILKTGKTHQLRLHFSYLKHPIIGDKLYGIETKDNILYLHSYYLKIKHPITNEILEFYNYPKWYKE